MRVEAHDKQVKTSQVRSRHVNRPGDEGLMGACDSGKWKNGGQRKWGQDICQGHSHPKLSVAQGVGSKSSADNRQPTARRYPTTGNTPVWFPGH